MATKEEVSQAVGCLSITFPQYVAKEVAVLTDQIVSSVQGFTDPLKAALDLDLTNLLSEISSLSEGDLYGNLGDAALGAGAYMAQRELEEMTSVENVLDATIGEGTAKRLAEFQDKVEGARQTIMMGLAIYNDMPYAAVQSMCETLIELIDLKLSNIECLRRHITQLINLVLVISENVQGYKDDTLEDLDSLSSQLTFVQTELSKSQVATSVGVAFDANAFVRAQGYLENASKILAPAAQGTDILALTDIMVSGSTTTAEVNRTNRAGASLAIPVVQEMIELEVSAVAAQIDVINHYIGAIGTVVSQFTQAPSSSEAANTRSRVIGQLQTRVSDLKLRVDAARTRGNIRLASAEMLLWVSRIKSIQVMAQRVHSLTFEIGSGDGDARAAALESSLTQLIATLAGLSNGATTGGIESYTDLRDQTQGLVDGSKRVMEDLKDDPESDDAIVNFHALAAVVATRQRSALAESADLAAAQKIACQAYIDSVGDLAVRERFDDTVASLQQLGQDRGVDLVKVGKFQEFFEQNVESLSYIGLAIQCITNAIKATDDAQTRLNLGTIRDELVGRQVNKNLASSDSADTGIVRSINSFKDQIANIQAQAQTVNNIYEELKALAEQLEVNIDEASEGFAQATQDLDRLEINAGGRLSGELEKYGPYPKAGVPLCFPV